MTNTVIVSNRLPVQVVNRKNKLKFESTIGGLATGLSSVHEEENSLWLGWCGIENEKLNGED